MKRFNFYFFINIISWMTLYPSAYSSNVSHATSLADTTVSVESDTKNYELTIYVIPSPEWLGWDTPYDLMKNTAKNKIFPIVSKKKKRAIGHVFVELTDGDYRFFGGMTTQQSANQADKIIKKGYNLGILFAEMDGQLDDPVALENELQTRYEDGDVAFMRFQLHRSNFDRLKTYIEEYQKRDYHLVYNGKNKPREGTGAGCSAFGVSFLEVAGILKPEWKEDWTIRVNVPENLMGGPKTGKFVSPLMLLTAKSWADEDEPHAVLELIEPYLLYQWIHEQWNNPYPELNDKISYVIRQEALGIKLDYSGLTASDEPIFLTN